MKPTVLSLLSFIFLFLVSGCEHKELCYNHPHGTQARIYVNWRDFEETPTGMSVYAYSCNDNERVTKLTNTVSYADLYLKEGDYQVLVYNQSPSEFSTFSFNELNSFKAASVIAKNRSKTWYDRSEKEHVIHNPEPLASGTIDRLEILDTVNYKSIVSRGSDIYSLAKDTVFPKSRIYSVKVTVHVKGIQNLRSIRASLTGMAAGCYLSSGLPVTKEATQLLEEWKKSPSTLHADEGTLVSTISSFGLPDNHKQEPTSNLLKLAVLLVDNKTVVDFDFNVGNRFEFSTDVNLELNLEIGTDTDNGPIELPDVKPSGGGGFDVDVDNWGDEEEIEIPV